MAGRGARWPRCGVKMGHLEESLDRGNVEFSQRHYFVPFLVAITLAEYCPSVPNGNVSTWERAHIRFRYSRVPSLWLSIDRKQRMLTTPTTSSPGIHIGSSQS
jgi:hypothetical protein